MRDPALSEARRADAKEVQKAADRTAGVARQLLAFSRRAVYTPQAVALDTFVDDVRPMVERLVGDGVQLTARLACPGYVSVDTHQMKQIVTNLVLNARDAMPTGGMLTLATSATVLGDGGQKGVSGVPIPAGRYGMLAVTDTGTGMDTETLARIFEPFFTTKPVGRGTGLGLSVLEGLVEQSGGYITVVSAPGQGTTFTLYFPLLPEATVAEQPIGQLSDGTAGALTGATVLIVDDEPAVRTIVARHLEQSDCCVLQAADGSTALEVINRHGPPDLVLTDLIMPGMGGAELARRLQARWPDLPILFISGYTENYLRRTGALEGEVRIIEKPFEAEALVQTVNAALRARAR